MDEAKLTFYEICIFLITIIVVTKFMFLVVYLFSTSIATNMILLSAYIFTLMLFVVI